VYITLAFFRAGSSPMANRTLAPLRWSNCLGNREHEMWVPLYV
jgi:hypothetical protein